MITIDYDNKLVGATVLGEFTLDDFTELEQYLLDKELFDGSCSLLFDLTEMAGFTVDVAVEEIKFSRIHGGDFNRIAIVTDSQWVTWSAWLETLFVNAELRVFPDVVEARTWLAEEAS